MKKLFSGLALLFLCGIVKAEGPGTKVYQLATSSITIQIVNVSTSAATKMDNPQLINRLAIEIQNIDSSANLWCTTASNVTTNNGRKITPGSFWILNVSNSVGGTNTFSAANLYCISDGASTTNAAITQAD